MRESRFDETVSNRERASTTTTGVLISSSASRFPDRR